MTLLAALALSRAARLAAQDIAPPQDVAWWQGAVVVGGIAFASTFDEAVRDATQESRTPGGDQIAATLRHMGQPEVFATIPLGMIGVGLLEHSPGLRRGGERVTGALVVAGGLVTGLKLVVGRIRPSDIEEPFNLHPFSGSDAFPSGHATMAFALATALGDEIHRPWATAGLMVLAAGTGWSRLNDNAHWLSDVVAGAAVGITSAQVMERRWTIFHIQPPTFLITPSPSGFRWAVRLPLP